MDIDLGTLRSRWNEVLDLLESNDRIAWLVFFDARLASFENNAKRVIAMTANFFFMHAPR